MFYATSLISILFKMI